MTQSVGLKPRSQGNRWQIIAHLRNAAPTYHLSDSTSFISHLTVISIAKALQRMIHRQSTGMRSTQSHMNWYKVFFRDLLLEAHLPFQDHQFHHRDSKSLP